MANVLSLAMKVSADASSVPKQLTPVERALANLGKQAERATSVLDKFAAGSAAAAAAQARAAGDFEKLAQALRDGLDPQEYARRFAALTQAAQDTANAFAEGLRITEANRTEEERRAEQLQRLSQLLELGAISEETFNRAKAEASGANAAAAQAEKERLESLAAAQRERDKLLQDGVRITQQFATEEERRAQQIAQLDALLEAAAISEETYARAKEQASGASKAAADAEAQRQALLQEGSRLTDQYRTTEEKRAAEIERINKLLAQGAISEETAARAKAEASGANAEAARAEQERAQAAAAAARIIQANLTPQERYDQQVQELSGHLQAGRLSQEQFDRAVASATASFVKAESAAKGYDRAVEAAGDGGTLKFNELSGVLAALPGPIGNVAGRLSGLASAGEGLSRVFAGGVSQGIGSVGSAVAGLVNPFTIGAAAVTGLGLAAVGISRGLFALDQQIEQLSNSALRLGTDFGTVQVLDEAARRSGQSLDALASGLQRFSINVDEARSGSGKAAEAFSELGISQEELRNSDPTTLAQQVATALQGIEDPARRAALATETLGKSGLSLLPAFNAIEEARQSMERFQTAISDVDATRVSGVGQAFDNLNSAFAGLTQSVLTPFAGLVSGITNLFADLIGLITRLAQAIGTVLTPVLDAIGETFKAFGDGIAFVSGWFDTLLGNSEKTQPAVANLRAEIEEPLQDNFAKEFQRTLDDITKSVSNAIDESAKFGDAGFDAAVQYQEQIAKLKEQLDAGLFNEETFRREAAKAGEAFRQELDRLSDEARLEIQIEEDAQRTLAGLNAEVDKAIKGAAEFGQQGFDAAADFQSKIDELRRQFEAGIINDEALKQGVEAANAAYDQQIDKIKQVQDEQQKLIEDDRKRVESLLGAQSETAKIEEDILAVQREAARLADEAAAARAQGNSAAADGAAARLAQLDQLQAQLDENLQAAEQGFGEAGFGPAFEAINADLNGLADRAAEFGNAGAEAFARLKEGVEQAQQQAKDGVLNKEALDQQVAAQQKAFEAELKNIDEANKARAEAQEAAQKQAEDQAKAIADFQKQKAQEIADARQKQEESIRQEQQRIFEERKKAEEAEYNRQVERITALNTLGSQSVQTADVRTQEGAAIVLGLAANEQDPALVQARLTNKVLNRIAASIDRDLNRLGQPALIFP